MHYYKTNFIRILHILQQRKYYINIGDIGAFPLTSEDKQVLHGEPVKKGEMGLGGINCKHRHGFVCNTRYWCSQAECPSLPHES